MKDILNINIEFINLLLESDDSDQCYIIKNIFGEDFNDTLDEFEQADTDYSEAQPIFCYFTDECFGVTMQTSHMLLDHLDIEIPYSKLKDYQKDHLLWREVN